MKSPRLNCDVLLLRGQVEVGAGDARSRRRAMSMPSARGTSRNTPRPTMLALGLLDAALLRAGRGDLAAVVAVPHGVLVEHVAQAVPLRAALQRHHHHVVGGADAAVVEHARVGVGAGAQHGVHRVDAAHRRVLALRALRPVVVEVERERDHLALLHQARRRDDVLGLRVVERADLVVRAPLAPVLVFLRGVAEVLAGELARRHGQFLFFDSCGKTRAATLAQAASRRMSGDKMPHHRRIRS